MYDCFMEKYLYQMFILGTGNLDLALNKGLGGVIFFQKDIDTKEQFTELIKSLNKKALIPPFMSIDQEGGRVERTKNIHEPYLSAKFAYEKGEEFLKDQTQKISDELKSYGINLNFAPCADVNTNPNNPIIGERAFSDKVEDVIKGVKIVSEVYRKNGIVPCLKHFPGHGDTDKDSHVEMPVYNFSLSEAEKTHIRPFSENINDAEMVMVAHMYCPCFDRNKIIPASISKNVINYLRKNLNYEGIVITDDMVMGGISGISPLEACIVGIDAGVNMFIFRNSDDKTLSMLEDLLKTVEKSEFLKSQVMKSYEIITEIKSRYGLL